MDPSARLIVALYSFHGDEKLKMASVVGLVWLCLAPSNATGPPSNATRATHPLPTTCLALHVICDMLSVPH